MAEDREIGLSFVWQTPKAFTLEFIGDLTADSGEEFLSTLYKFPVNADGTVGTMNAKSVFLPAPATGSRRYRVKLPSDRFDASRFEIREFWLSAGAKITLAELLQAGKPLEFDSPLYQIIDDKIAAALGNDPNFAATISNSIGGKLTKAANLSDLTNAGSARQNLGLGNVNNTSDANKSISTAQQAALDTKADKSAFVTNGDGNSYLANDGSYKTISLPAAPGIVKLSSTVVNTDVSTSQVLYTVPPDKKCIIFNYAARSATADLSGVDEQLLFGFTEAGGFPNINIGSIALGAVSGASPLGTGSFPVGNTGEPFVCFFNDTSVAGQVTIDVFGYLIDA